MQETGTHISRSLEDYPLTPSGFRALSITAAAAWRSGQRHIATSILAEMEATYAATRLSFPVEGAIQLIRQRIQEEGIRTPQAKVASIPVPHDISEPGLPGAAPLWTWQQELWKTPQIVPSTVVLNLPVGRSDLAQSVWKPAFRKNDIVLRTPTQVKCFTRPRGKNCGALQQTRWPLTFRRLQKPDMNCCHNSQRATPQRPMRT